MPIATRDGPAHDRYGRAHSPYAHGHGHEHCPTHCRYCGPDAEAWGVGEVVVGLFAAVFAVVGWLARHPVAGPAGRSCGGVGLDADRLS